VARPQAQRHLDRDGFATAWPKEGPPRVWSANVGAGYSSVAVSGGRVYTMGNVSDVITSCA